jgi:hypothetical protein
MDKIHKIKNFKSFGNFFTSEIMGAERGASQFVLFAKSSNKKEEDELGEACSRHGRDCLYNKAVSRSGYIPSINRIITLSNKVNIEINSDMLSACNSEHKEVTSHYIKKVEVKLSLHEGVGV